MSVAGSSTTNNGGNGTERSVVDAALELAAAGYSVFPSTDKNPRAFGKWSQYQKAPPTEPQIRRWFGVQTPPMVGVICGRVSSGLEVLDFDGQPDRCLDEWRRLVEAERPGLIDRLTVDRTPSGGYHVTFRVAGMAVPGGRALAMLREDDPASTKKDKKVLIETKGEGGYCVVPPTPGYTHLSGPPLSLVTTVFADEREVLIRAAEFLDERPPEEPKAKTRSGKGASLNGFTADVADDLKPGEDFDVRGPAWSEILEPHGWALDRVDAHGVEYWTRPEKDSGTSATVGRCFVPRGEPLLKVFSSNAGPFEGGKAYGRFRAVALLNFAGDFSAAARELRKAGYGGGSDPRKASSPGAGTGASGEPTGGAEAPGRPPAWSPGWLADADFDRRVFALDWLVEDVLVTDQIAVIGGPLKTLKTSVSVDLAISLAAGVPFLGYYPVPRSRQVAVISGESGLRALQSIARRVREARGVEPGLPILWTNVLPKLSDPGHLKAFKDEMAAQRVEVCVVDPMYLALLAGAKKEVSAASIYDMGEPLHNLAVACREAGVTPVIVHHANRPSSRRHEMLDLLDLSFVGIAEYCRQWVLLSRREKYVSGEPHRLFMNAGGSEGQSVQVQLDVTEGVLDSLAGRRVWQVEVSPIDAGDPGAVRSEGSKANAQADRANRRAEQQAKKAAKRKQEEDQFLAALDRLDPDRDRGATRADLKRELKKSSSWVTNVANRLLDRAEPVIEGCELVAEIGSDAERTAVGWRRIRPAADGGTGA